MNAKKDFMITVRSILLVCAAGLALPLCSAGCQKAYRAPKQLTLAGEEKLYPIGFSKDGNFAYIRYYVIGGAAGFNPNYDFVVQALADDSLKFEQVFENAVDPATNKGLTIEGLWRRNRELFEEKLKAYQIVQGEKLDVKQTSFRYKETDYTVGVTAHSGAFMFQTSRDAAPAEYDFLDQAEVFVEGGALGRRSLSKYQRENQLESITSITPAKVILSPHGDQAVVLVIIAYLDSTGVERQTMQLLGMSLEDK